MIDGLTGWTEAVPIADQSAATVARAVYSEWIARNGVLEQIHSDRGVQYESAIFTELCEFVGIDTTRTTPYRPQANGKCERFNLTLISMLKRAVQRSTYNWEPLLPCVLQAYRSTVSESTGFTPHRFGYGREMRLPVDLGSPLPDPPRDTRTLAAEITYDLEWAYRVGREEIGHGHKRGESRYNERVVPKQFKPGTLVRVLLHFHPAGVHSKLNHQYSSLCEVIEVRGPTLTLRELDSQRVFTASHDAVSVSTLPARADPNATPPTANDSLNSRAPSAPGSQSSGALHADAPPESQPRDTGPPADAQASQFIPEFDADLAVNEREEVADTDAGAAQASASTCIPSLLELEVLRPPLLDPLSVRAPATVRPRRNARILVLYESSQFFENSLHDGDLSSALRTSTLVPAAPRIGIPEPASRPQAQTQPIQKKPMPPVLITNAAVHSCSKPYDIGIISRSKRVTWAPRMAN